MAWQTELMRRGTGFFVSKKIISRTSMKKVKKPNDNVLWIQFIANKCTFYLASVYIPHAERNKAYETLNDLKHNCTELELSGTPIIMGDFNIRSPITGDNGQHDSIHKANAKHLKKFLRKTDLTVARNQDHVNNNTHWSFHGPRGGDSIPYYIMYPLSNSTSFHDYRIHPQNNCGSYHYMQTIILDSDFEDTTKFWKSDSKSNTTWKQENIIKYKRKHERLSDEANPHNQIFSLTQS